MGSPTSTKSPSSVSVADVEEASDCIEDPSDDMEQATDVTDVLTVEIDPCSRLAKRQRNLDKLPGLCLPSPRQSLLSHRHLLHVLGPCHYKLDGQVDGTGEEAASDRNDTITRPSNADCKQTYPIAAHETDVVFLDLDVEGDPRYTQGNREAVEHLHICPEETVGLPSNQGPATTIQHTPTTQLLRRSSLAHFAVTSCKLPTLC